MITLDKVVAAAMRHLEVLDTLGDALANDLVVASPFYRQLIAFVSDFASRHRTLPKEGDYGLWLSGLPEGQRQGLQDALGRLATQDISGYTPGYLAEHSIVELKVVATQNAILKLQTTPDASSELLARLAASVESVEAAGITGLVSIADFERLIDGGADLRLVPTGIPKLDEQLGGGIAPEFIILFADTGIGKTTTLANLGRAMSLHGGNVLHVSFEVWTNRLAHRYYRGIAQVDRQEFTNERESVIAKLQHHFRFAKGRMDLLYRPAYSTAPADLELIVDRYVDKYGKIDALVLDYLDLMAPPANMRKSIRGDEILGQSSHLVRALCSKHDCAVITAGQANKGGSGVKHLKLGDLGGAYSKNQAADVVMGLNQTPEESKANQARLQLLKVRDFPGKGMEVPLYVDMDLQIVADLDTPNTRRLMAKRGIKITNPLDAPEPAPAV